MIKVSIVGVGPGSADYIIPAAIKKVQNAQIVIGAQRSLDLFQDIITGEIIKLTASNLIETINYAANCAKQDKTVVILSTGDPGFSGLLASFQKFNLQQEVEVEVIPGISSIQICAARLELSWDKTKLFTFHDSVTTEKKTELVGCIKKEKPIILLTNSKSFTPKIIANFLINNKIRKETKVIICENLTLKNEKIIETTLEEISKLHFESLCIMVVKGKEKNY
ncbi:MAG: precorrin-6y C5,15-methyltransferase (decarboxylating) subunit CbiE [Crenarchaeota archaeon]|nr:precorrin-6y C5,15-methyltransferase (decarboxylating) subunit CbiE [Thermoproteota archaeon]